MAMIRRYGREFSAAAALAALLLIMSVAAPSFFAAANLRQTLIHNSAVMIVAIGMTLVILTGEIDISVGSQFAIAAVVTGLLAQAGAPIPLAMAGAATSGALMGLCNGLLVARLGIPSIVVTLATMVALRDGLRWTTEGQWVQNLPSTFQWAGLGQISGELSLLAITATLLAAFGWGLANVRAGRALYAMGSAREAARLAGISPPLVITWTFVLMGLLTGLAAALNAVRFKEVQSSAGVGLELKTIAAVVVGGASIAGGRGTLVGTLIGVLLLGFIGPALTYAGVSAFWEKAIQGAIILAAVLADVARRKVGARVESR
jgi:rhamnose transport system permease protein